MFSLSAGNGEPAGERLIECWLRALACRALVMSRPHPMPTNSMVSNSAMSNLKFSKRTVDNAELREREVPEKPASDEARTGGARTRHVPAVCRQSLRSSGTQ